MSEILPARRLAQSYIGTEDGRELSSTVSGSDSAQPHRYHRRLERLEGRAGGGDPPAGTQLGRFRCAAGPVDPEHRLRSVNQLRDPAILEENGRVYLLYAVAGESGIAIAELVDG